MATRRDEINEKLARMSPEERRAYEGSSQEIEDTMYAASDTKAADYIRNTYGGAGSLGSGDARLKALGEAQTDQSERFQGGRQDALQALGQQDTQWDNAMKGWSEALAKNAAPTSYGASGQNLAGDLGLYNASLQNSPMALGGAQRSMQQQQADTIAARQSMAASTRGDSSLGSAAQNQSRFLTGAESGLRNTQMQQAANSDLGAQQSMLANNLAYQRAAGGKMMGTMQGLQAQDAQMRENYAKMQQDYLKFGKGSQLAKSEAMANMGLDFGQGMTAIQDQEIQARLAKYYQDQAADAAEKGKSQAAWGAGLTAFGQNIPVLGAPITAMGTGMQYDAADTAAKAARAAQPQPYYKPRPRI